MSLAFQIGYGLAIGVTALIAVEIMLLHNISAKLRIQLAQMLLVFLKGKVIEVISLKFAMIWSVRTGNVQQYFSLWRKLLIL